ncbi:11407_t:CDS:2 [Scutellospora calospora]|uniref:11407_t:CDS:1 n=1 Tax=Scutellospora calospora TaxID=85575 RepID=A0ACA9K0R1_9GLOM|nr:11407_t:CDS:2 [Scutellospora calospora]
MYNKVQTRTYSAASKQGLPNSTIPISLIDLLDRSEIPKVRLNPPVYQISNKYYASRCFDILDQYSSWHSGYVGFDTETTVRRQQNHGLVSMIQIATRDLCFLFQVYRITQGNCKEFPPILSQFLSNPNILKVGVNATHDAEWLKKSYDIQCQGIVNLENIAKRKGYSAGSLSELTLMFGDPGLVLEKNKKKILKWNFDAATLDPELILYASADAFAGIQVYENILEDRMNPDYLNYESMNPMSREEEEEEIYELLLSSYPKGKAHKLNVFINLLESKYGRWIKTKPKKLDRHNEVNKTIEKFIEDGRLIVVEEEKQIDYVDEQNESANGIQSSESVSATIDKIDTLVKLPGISIETIVSSSYADQFFISKGLDSDDCIFFKEISSHILKATKKESLVHIYINNGKKQSLAKDDQLIKERLDILSLKGALIPGKKWNTLMFHPDWLKELEVGYEEFITAQKQVIKDVKDEILINSNDKTKNE